MKDQEREREHLDKRIERVLRGLGGAEPADGLERRVRRAIEQRFAGDRRSSRLGLWRPFVQAPWRRAVAVAAVVLLLVLGSIRWWGRSQPVTRSSDAGLARSIGPATAPDAADPVHSVAVRPISPLRTPRAAELRARLARTRRKQGPAVSVAGNHPAPEQPLTAEERLLLRLAHRRAPEEFDVLNPDARDAQARSDKAEFRKFFGPPPTGDSE